MYQKFHDYRAFAAGYDCPLESDGGVAVTRQVVLAPGRALRFVGLNSALLCTGHDGDEGELLIGGRQQVLRRCEGHELVVLCHHPLKWLQDREPSARYIRSRARVHIFGHMHRPFVEVESAPQGVDLLTISAGAVVPPSAEDGYQYTYNVIGFEWDANAEGLEVQILPRTWKEEETRFEADTSRFTAGRFRSVLRGPSSRNRSSTEPVSGTGRADGTVGVPAAPTAAVSSEGARRGAMMGKSELLRLNFFRDLSAVQRLQVLMEVGILPKSWSRELTHTFERQLFDQALRAGCEDGLASAVHALLPEGETANRGGEL